MIHRYIIEATDEVKGFEEAIEKLDREWGIEELEPCEDAISRQAVIDACDQSINLFEAVDRIRELKPVTSQPKTGHWIIKSHVYGVTSCSECGFELRIDNTNYCPNCGAKMENEVEE